MMLHRAAYSVPVLLGLAFGARSAELPEAPVQARFSAPAVVSASGQVQVGEISGVTSVLSDAIRTQLVQVEAVPARQDGEPVESGVLLRGSAVLTPATGAGYTLKLESLSLMPNGTTAKRLSPPRYPVDMYTRGLEGSVELQLHVDERGRVADLQIANSSHASFEKAVRNAAKSWTFQASGEALQFSVPVVFRLAGRQPPSPIPAFGCPLDDGQAHIVGQNGCVDMIEVTASSVR